MPELSRFYGIVIKMYYNDQIRHTFMRSTVAIRWL